MIKKKAVTKNDLISWYMEYTLDHGKPPSSVFSFAKANNFEETLFYKHFKSFEALASEIFKLFSDNTQTILNQSEEYKAYDSRTKLLSFYYTFFENLTANRSYVVFALSNEKNYLKSLKSLHKLKKSFTGYIKNLDINTMDSNVDSLERLQDCGIQSLAWVQLLTTIKFWLNDTSSSFEKTDIFIEKSVNASFDLIDTTAIQSVIDLGKFLFKEKTCKN